MKMRARMVMVYGTLNLYELVSCRFKRPHSRYKLYDMGDLYGILFPRNKKIRE